MVKKDKGLEKPEITIVIKKVKKVASGHHGGSWKVAYADFVTAMMAFFLMLWLLSTATEDQKIYIPSYFNPAHPRIADSISGAGGLMGGLSVSPKGAQITNVQPIYNPSQSGALIQKPKKGEEKEKESASMDFNEIELKKLEDELTTEELEKLL